MVSPEELCTKISLCDALIVRSGTKVTREVFERSGGRLKVGGRAGVGVDNVDLSAATEHGCFVVNAPTASTIAAAEHGIASPTAMARNIAQADVSMKAGGLPYHCRLNFALWQVAKKQICRGFARGEDACCHGVWKGWFRGCSACQRYASYPATSRIFSDQAFSQMKKGVRIVNVARGGVIDEEALVRALDFGIAALDVFTVEPPPKDSRLVLHENVTVTPHLGASTAEAQEGVAIEVAEAVVGALKGEFAATAVRKTWQTGSATGWRWRWCTVNKDDLCFCQREDSGITEEHILLDGSPENPLELIQVQIANVESKFATAISDSGEIKVEGRVKDRKPHLTMIGSFGVDASMEGNLILCRQVDQPGSLHESRQ
ncbi:FORMATE DEHYDROGENASE 1 [Salix purpurea]|uniref:FORMATE DEHYDROGENASE 1 n=1 Tax=Salix purpurea TaxID=77065 RepID=A0A9Q0PCR7_SALPP|nr:FORMATE DEHYDROGENASE 1 [Salix purpurea]